MARRISSPFRADQVYSLLRPERLLNARDDFAADRITAADLRAVEDEEIPGAIKVQEDVGLQAATDGSSGGPPGTWTSSDLGRGRGARPAGIPHSQRLMEHRRDAPTTAELHKPWHRPDRI
jgi:hypothetical protein